MKFAFALNTENQFEKKHFGDASQFHIYEIINDKLVLTTKEDNIFKSFDEKQEHGSKKKGSAIINFLKEKNVKIIVSKQFGRNIKMINKHFVPIIIYSKNPEDVIAIIEKHIHWIEDELKMENNSYKLFTIKSGIMKTRIKK